MDNIKFLKSKIRDVPNYPKEGIIFKDITPLLRDAKAFSVCIDEMAALVPNDTDYIIGVEARGFILGGAIAYRKGIGFVPARKKGKLPHKTMSRDYGLEYGTASLEIHVDAIEAGKKVVIVDDLLATGGTALATAELIRSLRGTITAFLFLVELSDLDGGERLKSIGKVEALLKF